MGEATNGGQLQAAVRSAVSATSEQMNDLAHRVQLAFDRSERAAPGVVAVRSLRHSIAGELDRHRQEAETFRVVLFGRTQTGKSSLVEALTGGDGRSISTGECDFTTEPRGVGWGPLQLVDTPGVAGYGRTQSRESLEELAAREVARADLVLLAFDNYNQQASEFEQIRQQIRAYGRPCIAVLNIKNHRWRDRTHPGGQRKIQRNVNGNAANLRRQLDDLGLNEVPIVAINSVRAVDARVGNDYVGPEAEQVHRRREAIGIATLEERSNLAVLESLLSECLSSAAPQLRCAAVESDILGRVAAGRARLLAQANELNDAITAETERMLAVFAVIGAGGDGLGCWPRDLAESTGLAQLESLRPELLSGTRKRGSLQQAAAALHSIHVVPMQRILRESAELIAHQVIKDRKNLTAVDVDALLQPAVDKARAATEAAVEELAAEFEHQVNGIDLALDARATRAATGALEGERNEVAKKFWTITELGAGAAFAVAVFVATNPVGWAVGAGAAVVSFLLSRQRRRAAREAEAKAADQRANALETARGSADAVYSEMGRIYWQMVANASTTTAQQLFASSNPSVVLGQVHRLRSMVAAVSELGQLAPDQPRVAVIDQLQAAVYRVRQTVAHSAGQDPLLGALDVGQTDVSIEDESGAVDSLVQIHRERASRWINGLSSATSEPRPIYDVGLLGAPGVGARTLAAELRACRPELAFTVLAPDGSGAEGCDLLIWLMAVNGTVPPALDLLLGPNSPVRTWALARSAFVMTRLDQLGPDLLREPSQTATRLEGKTRELADLVARLGVAIDPRAIMGVSAAPFGEDITSTLRDVVGVEPLAAALVEAAQFTRASRSRHAEIARARHVASAWNARAVRLDGQRAAADKHLALLTRSLRDFDRAIDDGEARLRNRIVDIVESLALTVSQAASKDAMDAAAQRLTAWRSNTEITAAIAGWTKQLLDELEDLDEKFVDELEELHDRSISDSALGGLGVARGNDQQLGKATGRLSALARLAGRDRDTYYKLVKTLSRDKIKFKPWGAIKGAENTAKLARGLAALGVAITALEVAFDERALRRRNRLREEVLREARDDVAREMDEFLHVEAKGDRPAGILRTWDDDRDRLRADVDQIRADVEQLYARANRARHRANHTQAKLEGLLV